MNRDRAESAIIQLCDGLSVPDALAALTEAQARILAGQGMTPETHAFRAFLDTYGSMLPARIASLRREALETAN